MKPSEIRYAETSSISQGEQPKGLLAHDQERAISKGTDLLADPGIKEAMRKNRQIFLRSE